MSNYLLFILLLSISLFAKPLLCDPRATRAALICTNRTASSSLRRTFITNFLAAMDIVTPLIARQRYAAVVNGTGTASVYAFGECMKDLSPNDCNLCFAQCKTQVLKCLPFQLATRGGRVFYDGCYLRYDDYDFFNESLSSQDRTVCGSKDFGGNNTVFGANAIELVRNLSVQAVKNDGFFVGSVTFSKGNVSVHGLAQCWEFVNGSACENCLENAVSRIASCTQKEEGRVLNAGCYLRYSTQRFYNNSGPDPVPGNGGDNKLAVILATSAVALLLVFSLVAFFVRRKLLQKRRERKQLGALQVAVNKSKLNFSYETLEKATNYFHESNKLGQGGSGSVYKGTLPGGEAVAVKRLFYNTTQWVDHFFNEVNLISGINHKNLVKLLGCSITGPESLLVYEFVPNQSLLDNLFVRQDVEPLSWEVRYKIILSAAEGLTYLHEESKLRIIHRDIKLSNILLDEEFTAKIADFGLVRLFPEDITHISATLAGTLGYMAPEYVVRGKLTEKADVYSFGVVVIEVVWDLYVKGRLHEAVDPALAGNFQEGEPSRLLQIGLLCVQASAELRPSMSIVVKMLTGNHEILQPTQPPFLNPNGSEISSVGTPSTSNSK
ncbi:cysteine-rich receptor-like protein kinase 3 [Citrus sinensis]|nr:cysteine-rich receptor-like protein kinase 3 [Citrus sinensis]